jgi:hypothetical protein
MYNSDKRCTANAVQIISGGTATYCNTYVDGSEIITDTDEKQRDALRSLSEEFALADAIAPIECTAAICRYNQDFICDAPNIDIEYSQASNATCCATFYPGI